MQTHPDPLRRPGDNVYSHDVMGGLIRKYGLEYGVGMECDVVEILLPASLPPSFFFKLT